MRRAMVLRVRDGPRSLDAAGGLLGCSADGFTGPIHREPRRGCSASLKFRLRPCGIMVMSRDPDLSCVSANWGVIARIWAMTDLRISFGRITYYLPLNNRLIDLWKTWILHKN